MVRDLIISRINKGAGTPLIIVISRSFLFSELNRLLSDGILAEPNVPKGDCKGITFSELIAISMLIVIIFAKRIP